MLGVALFVAAMVVMPLVDGLTKYLSAALPVLFLAWARFLVAAVLTLPPALWIEPRPWTRPNAVPVQSLRTLFLVAAIALYSLAIARVPLADALGAYLVSPLVATLLSALYLRERLDGRRIAALLFGFAGALLIVRPGAQVDAGLLMALASGVLFGCYLVATRRAAGESHPVVVLAFQYVFGGLLLTPFALWQWPALGEVALWPIALMGVLSAAGHLLLIWAFRFAAASLLAPLVYLEVVSTTLIGFVVFGDFPAPLTWLGIAAVMAGGLLVLQRGPARLARARRR